jgi:hypothetical protein
MSFCFQEEIYLTGKPPTNTKEAIGEDAESNELNNPNPLGRDVATSTTLLGWGDSDHHHQHWTVFGNSGILSRAWSQAHDTTATSQHTGRWSVRGRSRSIFRHGLTQEAPNEAEGSLPVQQPARGDHDYALPLTPESQQPCAGPTCSSNTLSDVYAEMSCNPLATSAGETSSSGNRVVFDLSLPPPDTLHKSSSMLQASHPTAAPKSIAGMQASQPTPCSADSNASTDSNKGDPMLMFLPSSNATEKPDGFAGRVYSKQTRGASHLLDTESQHVPPSTKTSPPQFASKKGTCCNSNLVPSKQQTSMQKSPETQRPLAAKGTRCTNHQTYVPPCPLPSTVSTALEPKRRRAATSRPFQHPLAKDSKGFMAADKAQPTLPGAPCPEPALSAASDSQSADTSGRVQHISGRPVMSSLFRAAAEQAKAVGEDRVAVLVCGNKHVLLSCLDEVQWRQDTQVDFHVHYEAFGF